MPRAALCGPAAVLLLCLAARTAPAEITAGEVRTSIERGVAYLKSQQNKEFGYWQEYPAFRGGVTALCTLALLEAGVPPEDPVVARALDYLRKLGKPEYTYVTALQTMVFCAADPDLDRLRIRQNVMQLESSQIVSGDRRGTWGYTVGSGPSSGDNSNSQFALLALHEAEKAGVKVDERVWRLAFDYWERTQNPEGSWGYFYPDQTTATGSMTCAGISSLVICRGHLSGGVSRVADGVVQCCQGVERGDRLEAAVQWMGAHFSLDTNPTSGRALDKTDLFYYRYGVERAGRLLGRRFFVGLRDGKVQAHDWYREGAERIVREQDALSGMWKGAVRAETQPHIATPLALLFLAKGRWPVVMAKVKHGPTAAPGEAAADWDLHSGGVQNLVQHVGRAWKRELTWQTIDLAGASVADLLESPVLFFSGSQSLDLSAHEKQNLKEYIDQGGFIFAEACEGNGCDGEGFQKDFEALMAEVFPDSALRKLRPDHPIWFAEAKIVPSPDRPLWGIDTCCRTSVVYCPRNLSCYWELSRGERMSDYPANVQEAIEQSNAIGLNVLAYATHRDPKYKLEGPQVVTSDPADSRLVRGALRIAKLAHGGGADDAPNALANLLRDFGQELQLRVTIERRLVAPSDAALGDYPIAFLHGRRSFQFSAEDRQALKAYLERGGFLFADAICASPAFAEAFRKELAAMFPESRLAPLPSDHPLLSPEYRGFDLSSVTLREPQGGGPDSPLAAREVQTAPLLEGLEIDGRLAVVFSPNDLSCALENQASPECKGYLPADARRIGVNLLLYALQQ